MSWFGEQAKGLSPSLEKTENGQVHQRNPNGMFSKIVWVSLGGRLYRVAPEHLRCTTERETLIFETNYPRVSFDPKDLLQKGEYEDLTTQSNPKDEDFDMEDHVLDPESVKQIPKESTSSSSTEVRYRKRSKTGDLNPNTEAKSRKVVQLVYAVDQQDITKFAKSPQTFIAQRNAKRAVEVSVKNLTGEELEEMEEAMERTSRMASRASARDSYGD